MYEHPFTIKEVAWLLSIRCLEGGSDQEFPVECPYCGDTRGKCSFCISKNGEIKNVFHCFHCGQGGNMLTLYADIMGLYGEDRCKTAYQEIINRLENGGQVTSGQEKAWQVTSGQADGVPACRELLEKIQRGELEANFFEGMGCVGGCVGGPKAILPREEGRKNVERYGDAASYRTPLENPFVMKLMERLGFETVEELLEDEELFVRNFD